MSLSLGPLGRTLALGAVAGLLVLIVTSLLRFPLPVRAVATVLGMLVGGLIVRGARSITAGILQRFLAPSGASTPYQYSYSQEQALLTRGDVAGAVAMLEARAASEPTNIDVRLRLAALYCRDSAAPGRAVPLLRDLVRNPAITPDLAWRATHMLVELYAGPLQDRGSAMRELARIAQRYPGTDAGRHAATWLRELKAEHVAERRLES